MPSDTFQTSFEGLPPAGDLSGVTVQPLQGHTASLPVEIVKEKFYFSSARNTSFYRTDGMRLVFTQGIFASCNLHDHKYLDGEIAYGNPYVRLATEEEIHAHKMRINPKGTMRAELTAELEADMRVKLEQEIFAKLRSQGIITDETRLQGTDSNSSLLDKLSEGIKSGSGTLIPSPSNNFQRSVVGSNSVSGVAAGSSSTPGV